MKTQEAIKRMREVMRLKHMAYSTEDGYCSYVRGYCLHSLRLPKDWPSEKRIESYLATFAHDNYSAATQNMAFNAILFFYRHILKVEPKGIDALRAVRPKHERNAPAPEDTRKVLNFVREQFSAEVSLVCDIIYGTGARVTEPLNLRIRDVDFRENKFIFRQAKHHQDRVVGIPCAVSERLRNQIEYARQLWTREGTRWPVQLPGRLHLKYRNAPFEWQWFWLFPARNSCIERGTNREVRWRMHEATIQRAIRRASIALGVSIVPHELRHGYATDCLNAGTNPRALQKVLGHKSLETTMGYCHAEALSVASPLDRVPL